MQYILDNKFYTVICDKSLILFAVLVCTSTFWTLYSTIYNTVIIDVFCVYIISIYALMYLYGNSRQHQHVNCYITLHIYIFSIYIYVPQAVSLYDSFQSSSPRKGPCILIDLLLLYASSHFFQSEAETEHKLAAIKAVCDSGLQPAQVWIQLSVLLEVTKSYGLPLG